MAVKAFLQKAAVEQAPHRRQEALELHVQRLDALQSAYWDAAMAGDVVATGVVLKIMADRVKLLGLDQVQPTQATGEPTIVIAGSEAEYVGQLQAIVENDQMADEIFAHGAIIDAQGQWHPSSAEAIRGLA